MPLGRQQSASAFLKSRGAGPTVRCRRFCRREGAFAQPRRPAGRRPHKPSRGAHGEGRGPWLAAHVPEAALDHLVISARRLRPYEAEEPGSQAAESCARTRSCWSRKALGGLRCGGRELHVPPLSAFHSTPSSAQITVTSYSGFSFPVTSSGRPSPIAWAGQSDPSYLFPQNRTLPSPTYSAT